LLYWTDLVAFRPTVAYDGLATHNGAISRQHCSDWTHYLTRKLPDVMESFGRAGATTGVCRRGRSEEEDEMTKFLKAAGYAGVLIAVVATVSPALCAAEPEHIVREGQGVVTKLGANASATTYWMDEQDGWHVVTTVDITAGENVDNETHTIVRFSSSLLPEQTQLISVPVAVGEPQPVLRVRRLADGIDVTQGFFAGARSH
jgi:hypothetical protein